jgi:hypothetical protein
VRSCGIAVAVGAAALCFGAGQAAASGTLAVSVTGKGDVTGAGIDCDESGGPDCTEFYESDCEPNPDPPPPQFCFPQTAVVSAGADRSGYTYQGWTGCDEVIGRDCHKTMTFSRAVTANFADVTPPGVSGVFPSGGYHAGTIQLGAGASDSSGAVQRVEFRVRGALVGSDNAAPYQASFNTKTVADGAAVVRATAFDPAGNASFAETSITIDNTAPQLAITSGPDGTEHPGGSTLMWTFDRSDATSGIESVECSVVPLGQPPSFGPCSHPEGHTVSNRPDGDHEFAVRVTDGVGLSSEDEATFSIDAVAPDTTVAAGPAKRTRSRRAAFRFRASEAAASFECKLDRGGFRACGARKVFRVGKGRHLLRVRAADGVGNEDATPARHAWKVIARKRR